MVMNETAAVIVGIDVSKAILDVAVRPGGSLGHFTNDEAGVDALVARMKALAPRLIVLEFKGAVDSCSRPPKIVQGVDQAKRGTSTQTQMRSGLVSRHS